MAVVRTFRYISPGHVFVACFLCVWSIGASCTWFNSTPKFGEGEIGQGARLATTQEALAFHAIGVLAVIAVTALWVLMTMSMVNQRVRLENGFLTSYNWLGKISCQGPISEAWIPGGREHIREGQPAVVYLGTELILLPAGIKWRDYLLDLVGSQGLKPTDPRAKFPPLTTSKSFRYRHGPAFWGPIILLACAIVLAYPLWAVFAADHIARQLFLSTYLFGLGLLVCLAYAGYNRRIELSTSECTLYGWHGYEQTRIALSELRIVNLHTPEGATYCEISTEGGKKLRFTSTIGGFYELLARLNDTLETKSLTL